MNKYEAELVRIIDGDTMEFDLDLGFGLTNRVEIRLLGVDTAETYGVEKSSSEYQAGIEQKQYAAEWLSEATVLKVQTSEKGKYGRWLGIVENGDGDVLNDDLITEFNVAYE